MVRLLAYLMARILYLLGHLIKILKILLKAFIKMLI